MNKKFTRCLAVYILALLSCAPAWAQTLYVPSGTGGIGTSSTGNVGIGTSAPQGVLDLGDGTAGRSIAWGGLGGAYNFASIGTAYSSGAISLLYGLKTNPAADQYLYSYASFARAGIRVGGYESDISFFSAPNSTQTVGGVFDYAANTKLIIKEDGSVGIGTTSPAAKLEVGGAAAGILIHPDSNSTPYIELVGQNSQIYGSPVIYFRSAYGGGYPVNGVGLGCISFRNSAWGEGASIVGVATQTHTASVSGGELRFYTTANGSGASEQRVLIAQDGNVGIGTTSPTQKLSVNGTIRAKEVIVDTGWSDYVFDKNYRLAPLSEVEAHIKADKHLPGIPSAQDVAAHGVTVGDMQAKLLAKIEELTLHQIEQEKRLNEQADRIRQLEASH